MTEKERLDNGLVRMDLGPVLSGANTVGQVWSAVGTAGSDDRAGDRRGPRRDPGSLGQGLAALAAEGDLHHLSHYEGCGIFGAGRYGRRRVALGTDLGAGGDRRCPCWRVVLDWHGPCPDLLILPWVL